jgi:hypothetical protein
MSFDQRWELLKPEIIELWLVERVKLKQLVSIMNERHDFQAALEKPLPIAQSMLISI